MVLLAMAWVTEPVKVSEFPAGERGAAVGFIETS
jgi:hypothetical protein